MFHELKYKRFVWNWQRQHSEALLPAIFATVYPKRSIPLLETQSSIVVWKARQLWASFRRPSDFSWEERQTRKEVPYVAKFIGSVGGLGHWETSSRSPTRHGNLISGGLWADKEF